MNGAGRPTSDMIRSRPVSRGTTGVSISRSVPAGEKKKPEEPAPVPAPPSAGAPSGAGETGDSGGAERSSEAAMRVGAVVPSSGEPAGSRRAVTAAGGGFSSHPVLVTGAGPATTEAI